MLKFPENSSTDAKDRPNLHEHPTLRGTKRPSDNICKQLHFRNLICSLPRRCAPFKIIYFPIAHFLFNCAQQLCGSQLELLDKQSYRGRTVPPSQPSAEVRYPVPPAKHETPPGTAATAAAWKWALEAQNTAQPSIDWGAETMQSLALLEGAVLGEICRPPQTLLS